MEYCHALLDLHVLQQEFLTYVYFYLTYLLYSSSCCFPDLIVVSREFVYPIEHGHECCKQLKNHLILLVHWRILKINVV